MNPTAKAGAIVMVALAGAACHHQQRMSLDACEQPAAVPVGALDLSLVNGTFDVVFVATQGPKSGQRARGRLVFRPQDQGLVSIPSTDSSVVVTQPTIGQLDLSVADIGAAQMGNPMSDSASTPGVGLYVTRLRDGGVTGVVARVGSASNMRDQQLFDGGYFTLRIARVAREGIWGTWQSSGGTTGMMTTEPSGHFCAQRVQG